MSARSNSVLAVCLLVGALGAFTVASAFAEPPGPPTISEPAEGGASLNPADVHMVVEFTDPDGDDHDCTEWQIRNGATGEAVWRTDCVTDDTLKVHIHLGDGAFVGSHAGRTTLLHDTGYTLWVRTQDETGESSEATRGFTTSSPGRAGEDAAVPWDVRPGYRVEEFAAGLTLPVDAAPVPDPEPHAGDPFLYVAELYGDIKVVSRDGTVRDYATGLLNFNPTGNFPGSGEHGIGGIAVDPETGDVFVSLVYEDEGSNEDPGPHYPKVIRLHSNDGGRTAADDGQLVIAMEGEPQGPSHQISNLTISPDGSLYVHNGDGDDPDRSIARSMNSYRGKVLRMTLDGDPLPENPYYTADGPPTASDYVFARGFRNPFGGAWRLGDSSLYTVENGPSTDRFAKVVEGGDYLWAGSNDAMTAHAIYNWNPSHAPVGIDFIESGRANGSGFPASSMGNAFVAESGPTYAAGPQENGKRIVEFALDRQGARQSGPTTLVEYSGTGRATAVGVAAAEGGLYFTDLYADHGQFPTAPGANVLRVSYCGSECPGEDPPPEGPPPVDPPDDRPPEVGDTVPPKLKGVRMLRRVFRVGPRATHPTIARRAKRGTAFRYRLSEAATVRIALRRMAYGVRRAGNCSRPGRKVMRRLRERSSIRKCLLPQSIGVRAKRRCLAPRRALVLRLKRRGALRRCVIRGLRGTLRRVGSRGRNRVPFSGRIGRRPLVPGRYTAVLRAVDRSGNRSRRHSVGFRVVRGAR